MKTLQEHSETAVLIVDDNEKFVKAAANYLKDSGLAKVTQAFNGADAVKKAVDIHPGLILLDINMPHISGFDVLDKLRELEIDTKVIIISVTNDADSGIRAINLGASDFIAKSDFFSVSDIKIKNTLDFGHSIIQTKKAINASILSNLDILERILQNEKDIDQCRDAISQLRELAEQNDPDPDEVNRATKTLEAVAIGASGSLTATAIVEIIKALSTLMR